MTDLDLPDVNVLVALLQPGHVHHQSAQAWFGSVERFATTPITESGFVRTAFNPVIAGGQIAVSAVLASLSSLRGDNRAEFLTDDSSLAEPQFDLRGLSGFRQVTDFHLVDLAAAHSARRVTFDRRIGSTLMPDDRGLVCLLD